MKISIKIGLVLATVLLFLTPTVLIASARPGGMGMERMSLRSFIEPIFIGHGFAFNGDQYHILDVSAIKTSDISPGLIRSMFIQKKTPEEIAKEISNMQSETKTRGRLGFAGQAYALNITRYDNKSLDGDVLTLPTYMTNLTTFTPAVVGHISLSMSTYEGDLLSTGSLTMNNTNYKVLLTSPAISRRW